MSLAILFHFLCTQHVSDINISIMRSLRLCCWITTLVVLFLVRCVLGFRCGWIGEVSVLQATSACYTDTTPTQPHRNSNTHRTKNNTTNVVIQQNSRKRLMMAILMSETCWVLTYFMVQGPSWEANWSAASQKAPRISRNPKVHYRTHKRPPPVSILGQPNPVHIPIPHLLEIQPNIIHPSTPRSPQWSPYLRFPHQDPIHPLSSPIRATCPAHLIILDFISSMLPQHLVCKYQLNREYCNITLARNKAPWLWSDKIEKIGVF